MNEEIPKPKKKFKGFTSLFQTQAKKNVKKQPAKKPFTGFSEFYKKIKDYEIYDEDDDYDSLYDPLPRKEIPKPVEKVEEPPAPVDKHFKPQKYFEWCKQRSKEVFDKYAEEEGDVSYNEENVDNERAASIKANSLITDLKKSAAYRKYEHQRKNFDQSEDGLSQTSFDINPWFNKMLNKWQKGDGMPRENHVQFQESEFEHELRNIYDKLNARETLQFDTQFSRKVNTYPYEFQFRHLRKRMENFLQRTKCSRNSYVDESDAVSLSGSENPPPWDSDMELPCQKKELQDYFNKLIKPKGEVDFKLEDFNSWYARMSFNYDRRFKELDKMKMKPTREPEDFNAWLVKNTEKLNLKYNEEFSTAMRDLKQTPTRCRNRNIMPGGRQQDSSNDNLSDLSKCNWSTSNVSSCRSMIEKLQ